MNTSVCANQAPDADPISPGQPNSPLFSAAEINCEVVSNHWVNIEYKQLILKAPAIAMTTQPGQFFHLMCPGSEEQQPYLRRPMSIYRVDKAKEHIEFLYKVQGLGTRGLATLSAGKKINVLGPLGKGFSLPATDGGHALIVARGVGLATMAPLAESAVNRGFAVTAILSARAESLIMSADYLQAIGADVIEVHDDDGSSDPVNIERLIREVHAAKPLQYMATCGSNRLLQVVKHLADEWQIKGEVALEQRMGCALGMCFACVKPFKDPANPQSTHYRRVCWDGPVFQTQESVSW